MYYQSPAGEYSDECIIIQSLTVDYSDDSVFTRRPAANILKIVSSLNVLQWIFWWYCLHSTSYSDYSDDSDFTQRPTANILKQISELTWIDLYLYFYVYVSPE